MPLFMDFHKIENITIDDVLKAHMADLAVQEKYGVKYHQFWVNQMEGTVFCLTEGPDAKTCELVHQMAHGNIACAITEVQPGFFELFMGDEHRVDHGMVKKEDGTIDLGYRSVLVASVRGITTARHSKDLHLLQVPTWAKKIVSDCVSRFQGRQVEWEVDDTLIGVFNESTEAVQCAVQIQQLLRANQHESPVIFKIGISADQPVTKEGEFFKKAIKLAHRLCTTADDNQIVVSSLVKRLLNSRADLVGMKFLDLPEEEFVSQLLEITDRHLSDNRFSIDQLCRDIGISRPQLYRKITTLTGRAPNNFLRDIRLEKAYALLKQKTHNIAQVALEVGYSNPSYFSKCFAQKFGCMPSELMASR
jgi:AraC-like DNA-binding protein